MNKMTEGMYIRKARDEEMMEKRNTLIQDGKHS